MHECMYMYIYQAEGVDACLFEYIYTAIYMHERIYISTAIYTYECMYMYMYQAEGVDARLFELVLAIDSPRHVAVLLRTDVYIQVASVCVCVCVCVYQKLACFKKPRTEGPRAYTIDMYVSMYVCMHACMHV